MKTIWKYEIETTDRQSIQIPSNHKTLSVQVQNGTPCLWAEVDTESDNTEVIIETFGTGHPMSEDKRKYIGTYQLHGGSLVFHVYERERLNESRKI